MYFLFFCFFFFKQKTAYEMRISDWSSDVCSSDLGPAEQRDERKNGQNQGDGADDERSDIEHGHGSCTLPPMRQEPFGSSMDALVSSCCLGFMQRDREPARFPVEAPGPVKGTEPPNQERTDRKSTRLNSSH